MPVEAIPYVDLARQHAPIKAELLAAVESVIERGSFILGPEVDEFEQQFAELCGTRFAVGVANGTDAILLALRALGIGPGDEVITAPNVFVSAVGAIALAGACPKLVDVGDDYNIDPDLIEASITPATRAILAVHLTGRPVQMGPILEIASGHGLAVLEDCAQAVLAEYRGQRVGSFGAAGCFSLHPLKTLNACGDAGIVTTNDEELAEQVRTLRNVGLQSRDSCVVWSVNSRLDTLHAAMLLVKMRYVAEWTEARRRNAARYRTLLRGVDGIVVPDERADEKAVYHTFVIRSTDRDWLQDYLRGRGIETSIHYPIPVHLQEAGRALGYPPGSFPRAERQASEILTLPVHQGLTDKAVERIAAAVWSFSNDAR